MGDNQRVSLGCGTLILIALIVLIFSGRQQNTGQIEQELRRLQKQVGQLQHAVDQQSRDIKSLERALQEEP